MRLAAICLAVLFWLTWIDSAFAGPVVGTAIGTFITWLGSGTVGALIANAAIRFAIGFGLSYLAKKLIGRRQETRQGSTGRILLGGVIPRSFPFGRAPAELSLNYANTWGESGGTPNAFLYMVVTMSDLPINRVAELWVGGEKVTWSASNSPATQYAIPEFNAAPEGKEDDPAIDHMWVTYYDGTQATADSELVTKFGTDPNRPYEATRIGVGVAYLVVKMRVNRELFSSFPQLTVVVDGIAMYDVTQDTTAGGSGSQQWDTPATWAATANTINLAVAIYNIIRGVRYDGDWVYGGQTIQEGNLPYSSWAAAIAECALDIDLDGGGTEEQFVGGGIVRFNEEPLDVIERMLQGANGRLAEIGGFFKIRCGAAGVSVLSFTDKDIYVTDPQQFDPFPSLAVTINGVSARYIGPNSGWVLKDAPQLRNATYEAEDGGRLQLAEAIYDYVSSGTQVQRLQNAELADQRAFRRHGLPMPPDAFLLEPLDVVSWTSERNGYVSKTFDIVELDDLGNLDVLLAIKELDPNAYDWDETTDELPLSDGPLEIIRPATQAISGWSVAGELITHDNGQRTAAIRITWSTTNVDDVIAVRIQVRLASTEALVFDGETPAWAAGSVLVSQGLASVTDYEVRGKFIPGSNRPTAWTNWFAATTPDARPTEDELSTSLQGLIQRVYERLPNDIASLKADLEQLSGAMNSHVTTLLETRAWERSQLGVKINNNAAGIEQVSTVQAGLDSALAQMFVNLFATSETGTADVLWRMTAASIPEGALAAANMQLRAGDGGSFAEAALRMSAWYDAINDLYYSKIRMEANRLELVVDGVVLPAHLLAVADAPVSVPIVSGTPNTITADLASRRLMYKVLLDVASAELQVPANATAGMEFTIMIEQDSTGSRSLTLSSDWIGDAPTIATDPEDITILYCKILEGGKAIIIAQSSGNFAGGSPTSGSQEWSEPGTYAFVIPPHTSITFTLWGGGGAGGDAGSAGADEFGGPGTQSKVDFDGAGPTNLIAGPGTGGLGPYASGNPVGGTGGTASGGDTNTNGNNGLVGHDPQMSGVAEAPDGDGGDAPDGGDGGSLPNYSSQRNGIQGAEPGGGGSGAINFLFGSYRVGGGGASGAKVVKVLASTLTVGTTVYITVGEGGEPDGGGNWLGGRGANGRVEASWS